MDRYEAERICFENQASPVGVALLSLLESLTHTARTKNDEAEGIEFHRNQGEIRAYKRLVSILTKPKPQISSDRG